MEVLEIRIENVYLHIKIKGQIGTNGQFLFRYDGNKNLKYPLKHTVNSEVIELVVNIASVYDREFLANGGYFLQYKDDDTIFNVTCGQSIQNRLDACSRIFPYEGYFAYNLWFECGSNNELLINSLFTREGVGKSKVKTETVYKITDENIENDTNKTRNEAPYKRDIVTSPSGSDAVLANDNRQVATVFDGVILESNCIGSTLHLKVHTKKNLLKVFNSKKKLSTYYFSQINPLEAGIAYFIVDFSDLQQIENNKFTKTEFEFRLYSQYLEDSEQADSDHDISQQNKAHSREYASLMILNEIVANLFKTPQKFANLEGELQNKSYALPDKSMDFDSIINDTKKKNYDIALYEALSVTYLDKKNHKNQGIPLFLLNSELVTLQQYSWINYNKLNNSAYSIFADIHKVKVNKNNLERDFEVFGVVSRNHVVNSQYKEKFVENLNDRSATKKQWDKIQGSFLKINQWPSFRGLTRQTKCNILFLTQVSDTLGVNLQPLYDAFEVNDLLKGYTLDIHAVNALDNELSFFQQKILLQKISNAQYIFIDNYAPILNMITLREEQVLVQIWHAAVGFKSVGFSRFGRDASPHPYAHLHKKYTYAVVANEKLVHVYNEVFAIEDEAILPLGMPRLKNYVDRTTITSYQEYFYSEHPELRNKKIILFGPTYRGPGQASAYYDFSKLKLNQLYDYLKANNYVFIFKMHPFTKTTEIDLLNVPDNPYQEKIQEYVLPDLQDYENVFLDFTSEYDINELFYVTDTFITDYSSAYYEYSLLKKPLLFFTPDREAYEYERGVHIPVKESAPGKVVDTFSELLEALKQKDYEFDKTTKFADAYFPNNINDASDKIVEEIILNSERDLNGD
ncbi:hypothetical protein GYN14_04965 [Lactococcus piscium]|nr:hypothetical protein [Lactococcus carnosus]